MDKQSRSGKRNKQKLNMNTSTDSYTRFEEGLRRNDTTDTDIVNDHENSLMQSNGNATQQNKSKFLNITINIKTPLPPESEEGLIHSVVSKLNSISPRHMSVTSPTTHKGNNKYEFIMPKPIKVESFDQFENNALPNETYVERIRNEYGINIEDTNRHLGLKREDDDFLSIISDIGSSTVNCSDKIITCKNKKLKKITFDKVEEMGQMYKENKLATLDTTQNVSVTQNEAVTLNEGQNREANEKNVSVNVIINDCFHTSLADNHCEKSMESVNDQQNLIDKEQNTEALKCDESIFYMENEITDTNDDVLNEVAENKMGNNGENHDLKPNKINMEEDLGNKSSEIIENITILHMITPSLQQKLFKSNLNNAKTFQETLVEKGDDGGHGKEQEVIFISSDESQFIKSDSETSLKTRRRNTKVKRKKQKTKTLEDVSEKDDTNTSVTLCCSNGGKAESNDKIIHNNTEGNEKARDETYSSVSSGEAKEGLLETIKSESESYTGESSIEEKIFSTKKKKLHLTSSAEGRSNRNLSITERRERKRCNKQREEMAANDSVGFINSTDPLTTHEIIDLVMDMYNSHYSHEENHSGCNTSNITKSESNTETSNVGQGACVNHNKLQEAGKRESAENQSKQKIIDTKLFASHILTNEILKTESDTDISEKCECYREESPTQYIFNDSSSDDEEPIPSNIHFKERKIDSYSSDDEIGHKKIFKLTINDILSDSALGNCDGVSSNEELNTVLNLNNSSVVKKNEQNVNEVSSEENYGSKQSKSKNMTKEDKPQKTREGKPGLNVQLLKKVVDNSNRKNVEETQKINNELENKETSHVATFKKIKKSESKKSISSEEGAKERTNKDNHDQHHAHHSSSENKKNITRNDKKAVKEILSVSSSGNSGDNSSDKKQNISLHSTEVTLVEKNGRNEIATQEIIGIVMEALGNTNEGNFEDQSEKPKIVGNEENKIPKTRDGKPGLNNQLLMQTLNEKAIDKKQKTKSNESKNKETNDAIIAKDVKKSEGASSHQNIKDRCGMDENTSVLSNSKETKSLSKLKNIKTRYDRSERQLNNSTNSKCYQSDITSESSSNNKLAKSKKSSATEDNTSADDVEIDISKIGTTHTKYDKNLGNISCTKESAKVQLRQQKNNVSSDISSGNDKNSESMKLYYCNNKLQTSANDKKKGSCKNNHGQNKFQNGTKANPKSDVLSDTTSSSDEENVLSKTTRSKSQVKKRFTSQSRSKENSTPNIQKAREETKLVDASNDTSSDSERNTTLNVGKTKFQSYQDNIDEKLKSFINPNKRKQNSSSDSDNKNSKKKLINSKMVNDILSDDTSSNSEHHLTNEYKTKKLKSDQKFKKLEQPKQPISDVLSDTSSDSEEDLKVSLQSLKTKTNHSKKLTKVIQSKAMISDTSSDDEEHVSLRHKDNKNISDLEDSDEELKKLRKSLYKKRNDMSLDQIAQRKTDNAVKIKDQKKCGNVNRERSALQTEETKNEKDKQNINHNENVDELNADSMSAQEMLDIVMNVYNSHYNMEEQNQCSKKTEEINVVKKDVTKNLPLKRNEKSTSKAKLSYLKTTMLEARKDELNNSNTTDKKHYLLDDESAGTISSVVTRLSLNNKLKNKTSTPTTSNALELTKNNLNLHNQATKKNGKDKLNENITLNKKQIVPPNKNSIVDEKKENTNEIAATQEIVDIMTEVFSDTDEVTNISYQSKFKKPSKAIDKSTKTNADDLIDKTAKKAVNKSNRNSKSKKSTNEEEKGNTEPRNTKTNYAPAQQQQVESSIKTFPICKENQSDLTLPNQNLPTRRSPRKSIQNRVKECSVIFHKEIVEEVINEPVSKVMDKNKDNSTDEIVTKKSDRNLNAQNKGQNAVQEVKTPNNEGLKVPSVLQMAKEQQLNTIKEKVNENVSQSLKEEQNVKTTGKKLETCSNDEGTIVPEILTALNISPKRKDMSKPKQKVKVKFDFMRLRTKRRLSISDKKHNLITNYLEGNVSLNAAEEDKIKLQSTHSAQLESTDNNREKKENELSGLSNLPSITDKPLTQEIDEHENNISIDNSVNQDQVSNSTRRSPRIKEKISKQHQGQVDIQLQTPIENNSFDSDDFVPSSQLLESTKLIEDGKKYGTGVSDVSPCITSQEILEQQNEVCLTKKSGREGIAQSYEDNNNENTTTEVCLVQPISESTKAQQFSNNIPVKIKNSNISHHPEANTNVSLIISDSNIEECRSTFGTESSVLSESLYVQCGSKTSNLDSLLHSDTTTCTRSEEKGTYDKNRNGAKTFGAEQNGVKRTLLSRSENNTLDLNTTFNSDITSVEKSVDQPRNTCDGEQINGDEEQANKTEERTFGKKSTSDLNNKNTFNSDRNTVTISINQSKDMHDKDPNEEQANTIEESTSTNKSTSNINHDDTFNSDRTSVAKSVDQCNDTHHIEQNNGHEEQTNNIERRASNKKDTSDTNHDGIKRKFIGIENKNSPKKFKMQISKSGNEHATNPKELLAHTSIRSEDTSDETSVDHSSSTASSIIEASKKKRKKEKFIKLVKKTVEDILDERLGKKRTLKQKNSKKIKRNKLCSDNLNEQDEDDVGTDASSDEDYQGTYWKRKRCSSSGRSSTEGPKESVIKCLAKLNKTKLHKSSENISNRNDEECSLNSSEGSEVEASEVSGEFLATIKQARMHMQKLTLPNDPLKNLHVKIDFEIPMLHRITKLKHSRSEEETRQIKKYKIKVKEGRFTNEEDFLIYTNFSKFCEAHNLEDDPMPFISLGSESSLLVEEKLKFVQYIGRRLKDRTLRSIYKRFQRIIITRKNDSYTPEEDEIILKFSEQLNKNRSKLAALEFIIRRTKKSILKRYDELQSSTDETLAK